MPNTTRDTVERKPNRYRTFCLRLKFTHVALPKNKAQCYKVIAEGKETWNHRRREKMGTNINEINRNKSLDMAASLKAELGSNMQVGIGLVMPEREGCAYYGQSKQRVQ